VGTVNYRHCSELLTSGPMPSISQKIIRTFGVVAAAAAAVAVCFFFFRIFYYYYFFFLL